MSEDSPSAVARQQAEGWVARLSASGASSADPVETRDFRDWLANDHNRAAWAAIAGGRYVVRPAGDRFRVVDIWTGATAVIAMTPQDGMSEADAAHTARLMNRRLDAAAPGPLQ